MEYNEFIAKYKDFGKDLYGMYKSCTAILPQSTEDDLYNKIKESEDTDDD